MKKYLLLVLAILSLGTIAESASAGSFSFNVSIGEREYLPYIPIRETVYIKQYRGHRYVRHPRHSHKPRRHRHYSNYYRQYRPYYYQHPVYYHPYSYYNDYYNYYDYYAPYPYGYVRDHFYYE